MCQDPGANLGTEVHGSELVGIAAAAVALVPGLRDPLSAQVVVEASPRPYRIIKH
jgi:hypothetical protein